MGGGRVCGQNGQKICAYICEMGNGRKGIWRRARRAFPSRAVFGRFGSFISSN